MSSFTGNPFMPFESDGGGSSSSSVAREDRLAADAKRKDAAKALALQNEAADKERLKQLQNDTVAGNALVDNKNNKNLLVDDDGPSSLLG